MPARRGGIVLLVAEVSHEVTVPLEVRVEFSEGRYWWPTSRFIPCYARLHRSVHRRRSHERIRSRPAPSPAFPDDDRAALLVRPCDVADLV